MGYIFNIFLGLDQMYGIIIGLGIVIAYSTIGGMRAIVYTDILQFIVLTVGMPLVLIFGVVKAGGVGAVMQDKEYSRRKYQSAFRYSAEANSEQSEYVPS